MKKMKKLLCLTMTLMLSLSLTMAGADEALSTIDTILLAGTTQAFTDEEVTADDLTVILEAGLSATSTINQQPWYFAVITNQEIMQEIVDGMGFGGAPAEKPETEADETEAAAPAAPTAAASSKAALGDSPVAIVIYKDVSTPSPDPSFDCGLACQNMVIAAQSLGYGTKIVSSPTTALNGDQHDALCEKLGVDTALQAVSVLLVGRVDNAVDGASGASVRSALEDKVSYVE